MKGYLEDYRDFIIGYVAGALAAILGVLLMFVVIIMTS